MGYLHIDNLYKNQDILLFRECFALEKVHGTSAHISFGEGTVNFFAGGADHKQFCSLFDVNALTAKFSNMFAGMVVIIYGEAYGGKMQKMGHAYGPSLQFIAFDVKVDDNWLSVEKAERVALALGLEFVPYGRISTDMAAIDAERDADSIVAIRRGMGSGHIREGVVLRPIEEFTKNNGARIICKHKRNEFSERGKTPKVADPARLEVLSRASDIADEWVTPMRLNHVLDKLPEVVGMEQTGLVIKAMIEDVYREGAGEVVPSNEASSAIGRKTAQLLKKHFQASLDNR